MILRKAMFVSMTGHFLRHGMNLERVVASSEQCAQLLNKSGKDVDNAAEFGRPIFFIDRDYTIEKTSKSLTLKAGAKETTSLAGYKCHRLFFKLDYPCRNCPVSRAMAFKTVVEEEIKLDPHAAFAFTRRATATPILDENGETRHLIIDCLGDDITIHYEKSSSHQAAFLPPDTLHNEDFTQAKMLKEQTKALSAFAGRMAHDINNSLALISTHADAILQNTQVQTEKLDANEISEYAAKIQQHVKHIVERLDVANSLKVHHWETIAESDFADLLKRVLTLTQLNQPCAHNDIQLKIADKLPPILTSEVYLERALTELLRSILANSEKDGIMNIHLDYFGNGDYFILAIRCRQRRDIFDSLQSILQQFYTQKSSVDKVQLGLLIAYATIRVHGGSMHYRLLSDGEYHIAIQLPRASTFD